MIRIICAIISMMLTAFVTTQLWAWLVVPIFALPLLTLAQAIAIRVAVWYLLPVPSLFSDIYVKQRFPDWNEKSDNMKTAITTSAWLIISACALLLGWVLSFLV